VDYHLHEKEHRGETNDFSSCNLSTKREGHCGDEETNERGEQNEPWDNDLCRGKRLGILLGSKDTKDLMGRCWWKWVEIFGVSARYGPEEKKWGCMKIKDKGCY